MLKNLLTVFAVGVLSVSGSAYAQPDIDIDFDDGTQGTLVETGRITGFAGNPVVGGGVITFPAGGDDTRVILGTTETNVTDGSFVASVDVLNPGNVPITGFFGVGTGGTDGFVGPDGSFGEPSDGPSIYAVMGNNTFFGRVASGEGPGGTGSIASNSGIGLAENEDGETPVLVAPDAAGTGVFTTVTLTFDAVAQTMVFESSNGASEVIRTDEHTFINDAGEEVTRPAMEFDSTNSRIFIGGSGSLQFDNLRVMAGTGGGDVLGDFNSDGVVDCSDLDAYVGILPSPATGQEQLDLDGDGMVTIDDANTHIADLVVTTPNGITGTFPGDANCDGTVDVLGDAFILVASLGQDVSSYGDGDFDFDGAVTVLGDAFILLASLGDSNEP